LSQTPTCIEKKSTGKNIYNEMVARGNFSLQKSRGGEGKRNKKQGTGTNGHTGTLSHIFNKQTTAQVQQRKTKEERVDRKTGMGRKEREGGGRREEEK
jgi:hypothetical protein